MNTFLFLGVKHFCFDLFEPDKKIILTQTNIDKKQTVAYNFSTNSSSSFNRSSNTIIASSI